MSIEQDLQTLTVAVRELTAALVASGALQTAQTSSAAASSPAVQAVTKAQKGLAKKESAVATTSEATTTASDAPAVDKKPWAGKTADKFAELQAAKATVENLKKGIIAINGLIGREQAEAVLARFGVDAVTEKPGKKHLSESQYVECFGMMLRVLSGSYDATEGEVAA